MRRTVPVSALVILIAVCAGIALAKAPGYKAPVLYPAGNYPYPVAVADFNDDGRLDVATGNEGDDDVTILLGHKRKKGQFDLKGDFPAGGYPFGIAAGEFTGDKDTDLAVADYDDAAVAILEGNGKGGFRPPKQILVGAGTYSVSAGDLNGDKVPDIVTADNDAPSISVAFGTKGGSFKPARSLTPVGAEPVSVAIAQFDGKGGKDIGVLDYADGIEVIRGNGKGGFKPSKAIPVPEVSTSYGFAVGQLDKKGRIDVWISRCEGEGPQANVLLLAKGKTGLAYKAPQYKAGGTCTYEPRVADVDGNGYKDAVVTSETTGEVSVSFNSKKGFRSPKDYEAVNTAYSVATGDFNEDGILDFAVPGYDTLNTAIVLSK